MDGVAHQDHAGPGRDSATSSTSCSQAVDVPNLNRRGRPPARQSTSALPPTTKRVSRAVSVADEVRDGGLPAASERPSQASPLPAPSAAAGVVLGTEWHVSRDGDREDHGGRRSGRAGGAPEGGGPARWPPSWSAPSRSSRRVRDAVAVAVTRRRSSSRARARSPSRACRNRGSSAASGAGHERQRPEQAGGQVAAQLRKRDGAIVAGALPRLSQRAVRPRPIPRTPDLLADLSSRIVEGATRQEPDRGRGERGERAL